MKIFKIFFILIFILNVNSYFLFGAVTVNIDSLSSGDFPDLISLTATIADDDSPVLGLTANDFCGLTENGVQQNIYVVPPEVEGSQSKVADIVIALDISGSMSGEIDDVKNNIQSFATALASSDIDYKLGLVTYCFGNDDDPPDEYNSKNLTDTATEFLNWVNPLSAGSGGDGPEMGFDALQTALSYNMRSNSQRIFILITDASSHYENDGAGFSDISLTEITDLLNLNNVTCHVVGPASPGMANSDEQYLEISTGSLTQSTGGKFFEVTSNFNEIINTISEQLSGQYVITYTPTNQDFDGITREVELCYQGITSQDSYTPGARPIITLTDETENLFFRAVVNGDSNVNISVYLADNQSPYANSITLYYKHYSDAGYTSVSMTNEVDTLWSYTLPVEVVDSPGVQFYLTTTDGELSASSPKNDPADAPYQFAVLPNEIPVYANCNIQPSNPDPGQLVTVDIEIIDTTYQISSSYLYYKDARQLLYANTEPYNIEAADSTYSFKFQTGSDAYKYYFYFKATDDLGLSGFYGLPDYPNILTLNDNFPPLEVSLVAPADNTQTDTDNIQFQWDETHDREGSVKEYVLEIAYTSSFDNIVHTETTTATALTPYYSFNEYTYYWRVLAYDMVNNKTDGTNKWSITFDYTPPTEVSLLTPADNTGTGDTTPYFEWETAVDTGSGIDTYLLVIAEDINFDTVHANIIVSDTSYTLNEGEAVADTLAYYYKVIAYDNVGNHSNGDSVFRFSFDSNPPDEVSLSSPENNSLIGQYSKVTFTWQATTDLISSVTEYYIDIATDSDFNNIFLADTLTGTSFQTSFSFPDGDYYWRVRAADEFNNITSGTMVWEVSFNYTPPIEVTLTSPADGDTINTKYNTTFDWSATTDTDAAIYRYIFQISKYSNFQSYVVNTTLSDTETTEKSYTTDFLENRMYYWRVKAVDTLGNTNQGSNVRSFFNDNEAPVTVSNVSSQWQTDTVTVNLTVTDDNLVYGPYYTVNADTVTAGDSVDTSFVLDSNGTYVIRYFSADYYGNTEAVKTDTARIDLEYPQITYLDYTSEDFDGDLDENSPYKWTLTATFNDGVSGISSQQYRYCISEKADSYSDWTDLPAYINNSYRIIFSQQSWESYSGETLNIQIRVTDIAGNYTDTYIYEYIESYNDTPQITANLPDITLYENQIKTVFDLDDYFSDIDNNDTLSYSVSYQDTSAVNIEILSGNSVKISPDSYWYGTCNAAITAADNSDVAVTDTFLITVTAVDDSPVAIAGNDITLSSAGNVNLDGSASYDIDGYLTGYDWIVSNGVILAGETTSFYLDRAGTYTAELSVTDNDNLTAGDTLQIVLLNQAPVPVVSLADYYLLNETVTLDAGQSYDTDGEIVSYQWLQSDTVISSDSVAEYRLDSAGTQTFTLKITDNLGAETAIQYSVKVNQPDLDISQKIIGTRQNSNFYTFAFEDDYPNSSDGDYNDFVVDYNVREIRNQNNELEKIIIESKALALNGGAHNVFGVKLNINGYADVHKVVYDGYGDIVSSEINTDLYNNLTIQIFDDIHKAFRKPNGGYANKANVKKNDSFVPGDYVQLEIVIENPSANTGAMVYQPYYYVHNTKQTIEVNQDCAPNGYPYVLQVPGSWDWPFQKKPIDENVKSNVKISDIAYPLFKKWRETGYQASLNWYDSPVEKNVYNNTRSNRTDNRQELTAPGQAYPEDIVTYQIKVSNPTSYDLTDISVISKLADELTYKTGSAYPVLTEVTNDSRNLTWSDISLAADSELIIYYDAQLTGRENLLPNQKVNVEAEGKIYGDKYAEDLITEVTVIMEMVEPADNLSYTDYGDGKVKLNWERSGSNDDLIKAYNLYLSKGPNLNYSDTLTTILHKSGVQKYNYIAEIDTNTDYVFGIRTVDKYGIEEQNQNIVKVKSIELQPLNTIKAIVTKPKNNVKIGGDQMDIQANIVEEREFLFETNSGSLGVLTNNFDNNDSGLGNPNDYFEITEENGQSIVRVKTREVDGKYLQQNQLMINGKSYQFDFSGVKDKYYEFQAKVPELDEDDIIKIKLTGKKQRFMKSMVKSILFKYRSAGDTVWQEVEPVDHAHEENPVTKYPWKVTMDITSLVPGEYEMVAVAEDINGNIDGTPKITKFVYDPENYDKKQSKDDKGNKVIEQKIDKNKENEVAAQGNYDDETEWYPFTANIKFPAGAIKSDSDVVLASVLNMSDSENKAKVDKVKRKKVNIGIQTKLRSGQKKFGADTAVEMEITVPLDNVGRVEGTDIDFDELQVISSDTGEEWDDSGIEIVEKDKETGRIRFNTKHFSIFILVGGPTAVPAGQMTGIKIYPNPFKPNDGRYQTGEEYINGGLYEGITFSGVPSGADIEIYDIEGQLVTRKRLNEAGDYKWDVKNDDNQKVASGVYFYVIKSGGKIKTGKIIVIR